jgi:DNA-binding CsgD family transcriptional regulator
MIDSVKNDRVPTKWFNSVLKSLSSIENSAQLIEIVLDIKEQLGFNSIAYGFVIPNNFRSEDFYIYSDDSPEWKQVYIEKEYWKIDTRIIVARKQIVPFRWSDFPYLADFISTDLMMGTWDGMTIPVHGPNHFFGFLHFTYCVEQKKIASWLQYIQPFIVCLAQHITEAKCGLIQKGLLSPLLYNNASKNIPVVLSGQQRKCLVWVAEGKSTEEIALILGISVSTVNKHLDSASKLLNTNSRAHAIAKVVDGKLIGLEYKKNSNIFYF